MGTGDVDLQISVVIPTYNRLGVLERALASVLSQDGVRFEVIVVDDGSTDGTADYLASLDDTRVRVVTQENFGVCAARNAGLERAAASFVTFLDSDDEALAGWLLHFVQGAKAGHQIVSCVAEFLGPETQRHLAHPEPPDPSFGNLNMVLLAGAFAISTQLLRDVGAFRAGLRYSEHTDLGLRLGRRSRETPISCCVGEHVLVRFHRDHRPYDPQLRYDSAVTILRENLDQLKMSPRTHTTYAALAGVAADRLGMRREARRLLLEAIWVRPTEWRNYARFCRTLIPQRLLGWAQQDGKHKVE